MFMNRQSIVNRVTLMMKFVNYQISKQTNTVREQIDEQLTLFRFVQLHLVYIKIMVYTKWFTGCPESGIRTQCEHPCRSAGIRLLRSGGSAGSGRVTAAARRAQGGSRRLRRRLTAPLCRQPAIGLAQGPVRHSRGRGLRAGGETGHAGHLRG